MSIKIDPKLVDALGTATSSALDELVSLPVGAGLVGDVHGVLAGDPGKKELRKINKNPYMSFVPGVGHSRLVRRLQHEYTDRKIDKNSAKVRAAGVIMNKRLTPLLLGLAGAIGGGAIGQHIYNTRKSDNGPSDDSIAPQTLGMIYGALAGTTAGHLVNLVGSIAGAVSKKRKINKTDYNSDIAKMAIPGYGMYELTNQTIGDIKWKKQLK